MAREARGRGFPSSFETRERACKFAVRLRKRPFQGEDGSSRVMLIPFQFFMPWPWSGKATCRRL